MTEVILHSLNHKNVLAGMLDAVVHVTLSYDSQDEGPSGAPARMYMMVLMRVWLVNRSVYS